MLFQMQKQHLKLNNLNYAYVILIIIMTENLEIIENIYKMNKLIMLICILSIKQIKKLYKIIESLYLKNNKKELIINTKINLKILKILIFNNIKYD